MTDPFRGEVVLLEYDAVSIGQSLPTFWRSFLSPFSGSARSKNNIFLLHKTRAIVTRNFANLYFQNLICCAIQS